MPKIQNLLHTSDKNLKINMDPALKQQIEEMIKMKIEPYEQENQTLKAQIIEQQQRENISKENTRVVKLMRNVPLPHGLKMEGNVRENIDYFKKMWNNYEKASGLSTEDDEVRISTMLSAIGEEASQLIYKIVEQPENESVDNLLKIVMDKLAPEINIRYERYLYNSMKQAENETYQEYFLRLKTQSKLCDYKTMNDELMVDKIICSIKDVKLREKLWLKKNVNLQDAVNLCKSNEETKKQLEVLEEKQNEINKVKNDYFKFNVHNRNDQKKCMYCGGQWHVTLDTCPARNITCHQCNKKGHFASVCRSKKQNIKSVTESNEDDNRTDVEEQEILEIRENLKKGVYINMSVILPNSMIRNAVFQLDSGADCCIIGKKTLCDLLTVNDIQLLPSQARLKAVNGTSVSVQGKYNLKIRKGNNLHLLEFVVVNYEHIPLLSHSAIDKLKLVKYCKEVMQVHEIKVEQKNEKKTSCFNTENHG